MSPLRQKMLEEMQLRRFSVRTQETYLHAVEQLGKWAEKSPAAVSEAELRAYFVYLTNERKLSRSSVNQAISAVNFSPKGYCIAPGTTMRSRGRAKHANCQTS